jgi:Polysaccharide deacetylase
MRFIARWLFFTFWVIGLFWLVFRLRSLSQKVICFHSVMPDHLMRPGTISEGLSISQSDFKNIVHSISKRVKIVTELGVPNTAVLTFDDGLANHFDCAMFIMTPLGISGYFFVPLCSITDEDLTWYDKVFLWCDYIQEGTHVLPNVWQRGGDLTLEIAGSASRRRACSDLVRAVEGGEIKKSILVKAIDDHRLELKEAIGDEYYNKRASVLAASQREQMQHAGHLIGAHSVSHDKLSLFDDDQLREDFQKCFSHVGVEYNTNVFCYPVGTVDAVDSRAVEYCAQSGFAAAFMNIASIPKAYHATQRFTLPRLSIAPKSKPW